MKWFGRSLLHLILLLLAVSLASFLLMSMSPVDPLQTNVGQTALGSMAPEQIKKLQAYWGVGVPVWKRFFSWISGICHGDFGISLLYRRPVLEVIAEKASASVWLLLSAWLFSGIVGIFLGIAAAAKRGKWVDRLITGYCIVIAGTPSFWLALVLLLLFTVQLPIFPIGFSVPVGMAADEVSLADRLYHAFLPACTLGLTGISSIAMHTREKVIEILESDYVLYARARGESGWRLIFRHGLRRCISCKYKHGTDECNSHQKRDIASQPRRDRRLSESRIGKDLFHQHRTAENLADRAKLQRNYRRKTSLKP